MTDNSAAAEILVITQGFELALLLLLLLLVVVVVVIVLVVVVLVVVVVATTSYSFIGLLSKQLEWLHN